MLNISLIENTIKTANKNYRTGEPIHVSLLPPEIQKLIKKTNGHLTDKDYDLIVEVANDMGSDLLNSGVIETTTDLKISEDRKQKLDYPMYSLNKEQSVSELKKWAKNKRLLPNVKLVLTPKYDGVSILKNEKTLRALSRGDGVFGQDITQHINNSNDKFTKSKSIVEFHTIGELIISKDVWKKYGSTFVRDNGEPYKNPRNMVAGLVNNDDISNYWIYVDHIRYGVADEEYKYNKTEQFDLIKKETGYNVTYEIFKLSEITDEKLDELYYKWSESYEIDGLVIDIEDKNVRMKLGRETNNNPAYARAYKANWVTPTPTKVKFIDWNVSKEDYIKPVINVEPFETEGVTISKATGYNAKFIKDNGIGKGSIVDIIRSGSVIPKIVNVSKTSTPDIPKVCPSCGTELTWNKSGVEIVCTNINCETKNIKKIAFFFSSLEVEYFGEKIVEKFYKNGYNTVGKILNMYIEDIENMEGMGKLSGNNIISQFDKIRNAEFNKIGHASGCFENLGSRKLKMIIDGLGGMKKFEDFKTRYDQFGINDSLINELSRIHGVSKITAISFMKGLDCFDKFIKVSEIELKKEEQKENESENIFDGKIFVFSGVRDKILQQKIIENGGDVKTSVSKNTTDMVVKDVNSKSSKIVKAKELGCVLHNIEEFKEKFSFLL